nr:PREDICTED: uncharacterized protein LOC109449170 [Rhinolophus sinicus]
MGDQIREGRSGCLAQDAWRSLAATPGFSRAARRGTAPTPVFRSGARSQGCAAEARVGPARGRRGGRGAPAAPWRIVGCGAPAACALFASPRVPGLGRCGATSSSASRTSSASTAAAGETSARLREDRSDHDQRPTLPRISLNSARNRLPCSPAAGIWRAGGREPRGRAQGFVQRTPLLALPSAGTRLFPVCSVSNSGSSG